ncbi:MAG: NAD(P)H-quinone oxidoreductase [Burkholderiaceae bacterium]
MRAVEIAAYGGPEQLRLAERPMPACGPGEVLLKVAAAGVNRPDATQRRGLYPPPPGITDIPGLDVAGQVVEVGADVVGIQRGQFLCALVAGGGYAEYVNVPWQQCLPIPGHLDLVQAASLPEVFFTAWNKLFLVGRLAHGETVLIQGGTSGVGMAAIQLAREVAGARVIALAGTDEKCAQCEALGVDLAINYRTRDWAAEAKAFTGGVGVDVILDAQAGDYIERELDLLATGGRLVLLATHGDTHATVNFRQVVRRRLTIAGSVIRARSAAEKGEIARELLAHAWPLIAAGRIRTEIQRTLPLAEAAAAHEILERNEQQGKLVLVVDPALVELHRRTLP